jgi:hypothetical protein
VDYVQGYTIGKPVSIDTLVEKGGVGKYETRRHKFG